MKPEELMKDPLLRNMHLRKQLKKTTIKLDRTAFTYFYDVTHKTPSELQKEAFEEQITIPNKLVRNINRYFIDYYEYLQEKELNPSSVSILMGRIRAFYSEYDIELPKPFKNKRVLKNESQLVTMDHIRKAVNATNKYNHKALITFLASSGMRRGDATALTVNDFIKATSEYHNSNRVDEVIEMLEGRHIIPCWQFISEKTTQRTITFTSPESTEFLLTYLKSRENLKKSDLLFPGRGGKMISPSGLSKIFNRINDKLSFGYLDNGVSFFHAHALRDFFSTTLNKRGIPYAIYKKMMGQSLTAVDKAYIHIDKDSCKREYLRCVKDLSTEQVKVRRVESEEVKNIVNELNEKDKRLKDMEKRMELMEEILSDEKVLEELHKK